MQGTVGLTVIIHKTAHSSSILTSIFDATKYICSSFVDWNIQIPITLFRKTGTGTAFRSFQAVPFAAPPVDSVLRPANTLAAPPAPTVPLPTLTVTAPPAPPVAAPEPINTVPVAPPLDVPELSTSMPDAPVEPAFALRNTSLPLVLAVPSPVSILTKPPVDTVLRPASTLTEPPAPLVPLPTVTLTEPPVPPVYNIARGTREEGRDGRKE